MSARFDPEPSDVAMTFVDGVRQSPRQQRDVSHVDAIDPALIRAAARYINELAWGRRESADKVRGPDGQRLTWASIPADRRRDVELIVDDVLEWAARWLEGQHVMDTP